MMAFYTVAFDLLAIQDTPIEQWSPTDWVIGVGIFNQLGGMVNIDEVESDAAISFCLAGGDMKYWSEDTPVEVYSHRVTRAKEYQRKVLRVVLRELGPMRFVIFVMNMDITFYQQMIVQHLDTDGAEAV